MNRFFKDLSVIALIVAVAAIGLLINGCGTIKKADHEAVKAKLAASQVDHETAATDLAATQADLEAVKTDLEKARTELKGCVKVCPPKDVVFTIMTPFGPRPMMMPKGYVSDPKNIWSDEQIQKYIKQRRKNAT